MKVITENAAYVQKYCATYLLKSTLVTQLAMPSTMLKKICGKKFYMLDSKDFIKFTDKAEIDYIKKCTWIPDFNDYKDKDPFEIKKKIYAIEVEGSKLNEFFDYLSEEGQFTEFDYQTTRATMLIFEKNSLRDIAILVENNEEPKLEPDSFCKRLRKFFS